MAPEIVCLDWRPLERNTLRGFARIKVEKWHLAIDGIAIHERDGQRWAQLPSKPMLDTGRELIRDADGKPKYSRVLEFDGREIADRFSMAVVEAVDQFVAASDRVDSGAF